MIMFIIQSALLLAIAFIIGAIIGCILQRLFGSGGPGATVGTRTDASADHAATPAASFGPSPAASAYAGAEPLAANVRTTSLAKDASAPAAPVSSLAAAPVPASLAGSAVAPAASSPARKASGPDSVPAALAAVADASKTGISAKAVKQETADDAGKTAPSDNAAKAEKTGKAGQAGKTSKPEIAAKAEISGKAEKPGNAAAAARDDIKLIVGIGRTNEKLLNGMGVFTFAQIADWSKGQQKEIGEKLAFPGRIEREQWVKQARSLMTGKNPIPKGAFKSKKKKN